MAVPSNKFNIMHFGNLALDFNMFLFFFGLHILQW